MTPDDDRDADTAAKVCFLEATLAEPGAPAATIETHLSWVVLGRGQVLKLKKPVRLPFLDLSSVGARERNARAELALNRRLAPHVYLGVVALRWDGHAFSLQEEVAAPGSTVDWLVRMRRLPADRMLDACIDRDAVSLADIDALARTLAAFYRAAPSVALKSDAYIERMEAEQRENRALLIDPRFLGPACAELLDRYEAALERCGAALAARAEHGYIVDGHGDLRPEHVCLLDPPVVIDCLEFSAALRAVDPLDELAFLGLECDMAGAAWIGDRLLERCAEAVRADDAPGLRCLYAARRALLRARLMVAHLLDAQPRTPERWLPRARTYLAAAGAALAALNARAG